MVAMEDPGDYDIIADLQDISGYYIVPVIADAFEIRRQLDMLYGEEAVDNIASQWLVERRLKERTQVTDSALLEQLSSAPAVRLIDSLIESGVISRASDIHIEPFESYLKTRYRVDGELVPFRTVNLGLLPSIISRLKIMGDMDITEKRIPQDGHFSLRVLGTRVEFRVSTMPTRLGEKAALRLLYGDGARLKKEDLGFFEEDLAVLTKLFHMPHGAIIMTGPTGSGKSTTLTCFLEEFNNEKLNIVTAEDPVENPIPGVNHISVDPQAGLGFANALRHILRQDPDIIMIGEMRDSETAKIAIQAAITGHVVLSTLHTNDAPGVIERVIDMGVEPFLVAAAINGIIAQRLARRICTACKKPAKLTASDAKILGIDKETTVYAGVGCEECNFKGDTGRIAVYEYILIDDKLRSRITSEPAKLAAKLRKKEGLKRNIARNVALGRISVAEGVRLVGGGEKDGE